MHRSWGAEPFDFAGALLPLEGADALPKPVQQPHPPLILGGKAGPRGAALAARWADEYNTVLRDPGRVPRAPRADRRGVPPDRARADPVLADDGASRRPADPRPPAPLLEPACGSVSRARGRRRRARDAPAPAPRRSRDRSADRPRGDPGGPVTAGYPAPRLARDWHDLFITDGGTPGADAPTPARPERRPRLLPPPARVDAQDARGARGRGPGDAVRGRPRRGDLGAARGGADLRRRRRPHDRPGGRAARARGRGGRRSSAARRSPRRLAELLAELARTGDDTIDIRPDPTVILVVGVNGTGKTTTIGKLAWHLRQSSARRS